VPSKVSVFAIKAANNGLPTRVNKKYRHLEQQDVCQICGSNEEDVFHALLVCPHAVALRQAMRDHWSLPLEELIETGLDWLLMLVLNNSLEVLANLSMLSWHTWSIRNKVIHEGASPFIASSVIFLTRYMQSLLIVRQQGDYADLKGKRALEPAGRSSAKVSVVHGTVRWRGPPQGTLKINVDAAFNQLSGDTSVGVVIRDWEGSLKLTAWRVISHCRDAEEAEACLEGVCLALRWPNIPIIGLSFGGYQALLQRTRSLFYWPIIEEAREVGDQLRSLAIKISRVQNNLAYELAQFAIKSRSVSVFFACFPEWVSSLSCKDVT
jgi:hypothetical protein